MRCAICAQRTAKATEQIATTLDSMRQQGILAVDAMQSCQQQAQAITRGSEFSALAAAQTLQAAQSLGQLVLDLQQTASKLGQGQDQERATDPQPAELQPC